MSSFECSMLAKTDAVVACNIVLNGTGPVPFKIEFCFFVTAGSSVSEVAAAFSFGVDVSEGPDCAVCSCEVSEEGEDATPSAGRPELTGKAGTARSTLNG